MSRSFLHIIVTSIFLSSLGQTSSSMDLLAQQEGSSPSSTSKTPHLVQSWHDVVDAKISTIKPTLPESETVQNFQALMKESMEICCHPEMSPENALQVLQDFSDFYGETQPRDRPDARKFLWTYTDKKLGYGFQGNSEDLDPHLFENVFWMIQGLPRQGLKVRWKLDESVPSYPDHKLIALAWPVMQHQQNYEDRYNIIRSLRYAFKENPLESLEAIFKEHGNVLAPMARVVTTAQVFAGFPKDKQTREELVHLGSLQSLFSFHLEPNDSPEFCNQDPQNLYDYTVQLRNLLQGLDEGTHQKAGHLLNLFERPKRLKVIPLIRNAISFDDESYFLDLKSESFNNKNPSDVQRLLEILSYVYTKHGALKRNANSSNTFFRSYTYRGFYEFLISLHFTGELSEFLDPLFQSGDLVHCSLGLSALAKQFTNLTVEEQNILLKVVDPFEPTRLNVESKRSPQNNGAEISYTASLERRAAEIELLKTLPPHLRTKENCAKIRAIPSEHWSYLSLRFDSIVYRAIKPELRVPILDMVIHGLSMPHMQNPKSLIEFICSNHKDLTNPPEREELDFRKY